MKILIPTAKELNSKAEKVSGKKLSKKTKSIINEFSLKTIEELKSIYKIKEDKAKEEYARWEKLSKTQIVILHWSCLMDLCIEILFVKALMKMMVSI